MTIANFGFVYLLSNDSMPGLYKIGYTHNSPLNRAHELSRSTSCPSPFEVVFYIEIDDPREAEKRFHNQLSDYRINSQREFFRFDIETLITHVHYLICCPEESGAINIVETSKFSYFSALFHGKEFLNLSPDEIIK